MKDLKLDTLSEVSGGGLSDIFLSCIGKSKTDLVLAAASSQLGGMSNQLGSMSDLANNLPTRNIDSAISSVNPASLDKGAVAGDIATKFTSFLK